MDIKTRIDRIARAVHLFGGSEDYRYSTYMMDIEAIRSEVARMTEEIKRLQAGGCARYQNTTQYCAEAAEMSAEVAKLRLKLDLTECLLKDANERVKLLSSQVERRG